MSSSASMKIFSAPPDKFDLERLRKNVFSTAIDSDGRRSGWVGLGDPLDMDFSFGLDNAGIVGFSLRVDFRSASSAAIAIQFAEALKEKEASGEKLKGQAKKDLKEAIVAKLLSQAPFVPALTDCLWDMNTGRLMVGATAEKPLQAVLQRFESTFGIAPQALEAKSDIQAIFANICKDAPFECGDYSLSPCGSASLAASGQEEEKSQIAVQNNPYAVASALDGGMEIKKLRLHASSSGDQDLCLDFVLDNSLAVSGLKLPKGDKGADPDAEFILKADACSRVADIVEILAFM